MTDSTMNLDDFQRLLWGFAGHRVITVAGRTGILRLLAEKDCTPTEIASKLDLDPLAAGKVVRALTALGIVEAEGERYRAAQGLRQHFLPAIATSCLSSSTRTRCTRAGVRPSSPGCEARNGRSPNARRKRFAASALRCARWAHKWRDG